MVAVTVLTLLVSMMGTVLGTMGAGWVSARNRVNNFTKARAMLDLMTRDLQSALYRADLPVFTLASFYTQRPGADGTSGGSNRYVSVVGYKLDEATLQRSSLYIDWNNDPTVLAFGQTAQTPPQAGYDDVATGVIDFKVLYLQKDGTYSTTYTSATRAIGVTLAVVDDQTMGVLTQVGNAATRLRADLDGSASLTRSVKADWEDHLKGQGQGKAMNWDAYPKPLGPGLKIFERYVSLPNAS